MGDRKVLDSVLQTRKTLVKKKMRREGGHKVEAFEHDTVNKERWA